jgi:hypothetical protein
LDFEVRFCGDALGGEDHSRQERNENGEKRWQAGKNAFAALPELSGIASKPPTNMWRQ